jgi:hypothetical protein
MANFITIDPDAERAKLERLDADVLEARARLNRLTEQAATQRQFLTLLDAWAEQSDTSAVLLVPDAPGDGWPATIRAGIREVMEVGGIWSPKEVAASMLLRGWKPGEEAENAVAGALNRMAKVPNSGFTRLGHAQYRYATPGTVEINGTGAQP